MKLKQSLSNNSKYHRNHFQISQKIKKKKSPKTQGWKRVQCMPEVQALAQARVREVVDGELPVSIAIEHDMI